MVLNGHRTGGEKITKNSVGYIYASDWSRSGNCQEYVYSLKVKDVLTEAFKNNFTAKINITYTNFVFNNKKKLNRWRSLLNEKILNVHPEIFCP